MVSRMLLVPFRLVFGAKLWLTVRETYLGGLVFSSYSFTLSFTNLFTRIMGTTDRGSASVY